jgi:lipopolysaccharide export system protein LptA
MNARYLQCVAVLAVLAWVGSPATAQKKPGGGGSAASDVTVITSEKLTFDYLKKYAFFEKDVVVVDPEMKIFSDTMRVEFDEDNNAEKITAKGNVIIVQEDKRARAAEAVYEVPSGRITLKGEPMVTRGRDIFTAQVITYWRDDERIEGQPQARLVIYPDDDSRRDSLFKEPARD